jgi:predicted DNA-binding transcriptional regulator YafY
MKSNQTARVLELLKRFNNGEKVSIDKLTEDAKEDAKFGYENLWLNSDNKPVSEKTIRRDLDVIKEYFPESFELVRGGEKSTYKAITKEAFNNFINPEFMSLMVQMFNLANKSDLFDNFELDKNDKLILESKIKDTTKFYEFKNKPFENFKNDSVLLKELESKIKHQKYINIEYDINGKINKFEVKPYKIVFINENFYLACEIEHEKLDFALYRLSKIKSIEDTSKTYHKNIEIDDFIKDMQTPFSAYKRDYKKHMMEVIIEVDSVKAFFFKSKKYLKSQDIIKEKEDGNLIISYKITQDKEIDELIKRWIPYVRVISPLSLKEEIENELRDYLNR